MGGHGVDDEEHRRKHDRDQFNLHTSLISADMHDLRVAACIRDRRGKSLLVQRLLDPRAADAVLARAARDLDLELHDPILQCTTLSGQVVHCNHWLPRSCSPRHRHHSVLAAQAAFFLLQPRSSCSSRDVRTPAPARGRHILSGVGRGHRMSSSVFRCLTVEEPLDHLARPASHPSIVLEQPARLPRRVAEHMGNAGTIA